MSDNEFDGVINFVAPQLRDILKYIPNDIKAKTYEIRLRKDRPIVLFGSFGISFVGKNSLVSSISTQSAEIVMREQLEETMSLMCEYSVYSYQNDIADGFVTFGEGHRAGFCGKAVLDKGNVFAVRDISSINIRISRDHIGASDELINALYSQGKLPSVIIAGAPCSGKTTILRDLAYRISSEYSMGFRKTVVIDERYELGKRTGINCDVLSGYPKDLGIERAVRTLSPEIIICDEIGTQAEAEKVIKGLNSGVTFAVSIHSNCLEDLLQRQIAKTMISSGEFDYIAILDTAEKPGKISKIIRTVDLFDKKCGNVHSCGKLIYSGIPCDTS